MTKPRAIRQRPGAMTIVLVLAITGIVLAALLSISVIATNQIGQVRDLTESDQTFFAAESGLNIALERIRSVSFPTVDPFVLNGVNVTVETTLDPNNPYGRIITSHAEHPNGQERTVEIKVITSTFAVALNNAVHAGVGGIQFNNGSIIYGDAHSNGSVLPVTNGDQGEVRPVPDDGATATNESLQFPGNLTVSGSGNVASQLLVSNAVWAHTLKGTNGKRLDAKTAKYELIGPANPDRHVYALGTQCQTNNDNGACDANAGVATDQPLPIGTTEITNWANDVKTAADAGTVMTGNQNITGNVVWTGATKVIGNITFSNNSTLTVSGALWVTGNVTVSNNSEVTLGSNALIGGALTLLANTRIDLAAAMSEDDGVVILGDPSAPSATAGKILIENGASVEGTGNAKSSLTLISTNTSSDPNSPAIDAANTATGVIYFAKDGTIRVRPTGNLNAVFANSVYLDTNAKVTFRPSLHFFSIPDPNPDPIGIQLGTWREK